ncbi:MAG: phosphatidate cytidylyltransferase [Promethearchaeota archaeon]
MNILGLINATLLWFYGALVISLTVKHWDHPHKTTKIRVSEIIYGIAFIINGFAILFIFHGVSDAAQNFLYAALLVIYGIIMAFLWGNILYTKVRVSKHPELLDKALMEEGKVPIRDADLYWETLAKQYEEDETSHKKDVKKDLSRKALHLVILAVVVGSQELSNAAFTQGFIAGLGLTPTSVRNFLYFVLGFFFIFMFSTADMVRVYKFEYLPDWGLKWYGTSVEPKTEKYTYISSVPFLLSLMLTVFFPFAVILAASMVSCIADSAASIVGKSWGKHKLGNFGVHPHKSWEGVVAGTVTAFAGVVVAFTFYPVPGVTIGYQVLLGLLAAGAFVYADCFAKYVVDNVLNTVVPAVLIMAAILLIP